MATHSPSRALKSARSAGAVGPNAILPRFIVDTFAGTRMKDVLDFGAGPEAIHTQFLWRQGFSAVAHDLPENSREYRHDPQALSHTYDIVFASNVLNVQETERGIVAVLDQLSRVSVKSGGVWLLNFPKKPRYSSVTDKRLLELCRNQFRLVSVVPEFSTLVVVCQFPKVPNG